MVGEGANRFVGVGTDHYADHDDLNYPVAEVSAVAEHLAEVFHGETLYDPDETTVRAMLKAVAAQRTESMIVLWAGHGIVRPNNRLALPVSDAGGVVSASDVVDFCAESGASQLLCIIDTCYAGTTVHDAMATATAWTEQFPTDGDKAWFGVLVSAGAGQTARDGEFGTVLRRLLTEGPRSADMRRRWSRQNRMILGEDLGHAITDEGEWDTDDQRPVFHRSGHGIAMIPNPMWTPRAPARVVEHLLRAARSGATEGEGSWFTGRRGEVDQVVSWVRDGRPGARVVTGSAGTGKSAILGRVVSVSHPDERTHLDDPAQWDHADPGPDSVHANAHARGLTVDRLAVELDDALVQTGVLVAAEAGSRSGAELVGALQRHAESPDAVVPVLVVDGLDEARGEAFTIAADLLCRIAAFATVIISTRDVPAIDATTTLVEQLSPTHTIDLNEPAGRVSQREAIDAYLRRRLADASAVMDPKAVAARVVAMAGEVQTPFLLARIIADQLRAHPIDTGIPGWESGLVVSLGHAFDTDLHRISAAPDGLVLGQDWVGVARGVLTALTWGLGAGLPEPEWACVASAVTGVEIGSREISWVLGELGRYVVEDGEDEVAVYRLAHQSLADHLRPPFQPSYDTVFDPAASPVTTALLHRYRALLADGHPADAPKYLWRYVNRHTAVAGPEHLNTFRELAAQAPRLRPDLATADLTIANALAAWGHRHDAVPPTEEAVDLWRAQAADNPAYLPDLAGALNNLGIRYSEIGRRADAITPTEEAVNLRRAQAADNPAYLPDLAAALNNLGVYYSEIGRRADAITPTEEAVNLRRAQATDNPAYLPDLAAALGNLGNRYSEIGRRADAITPTEEAVNLWRIQAHDNPAHLPDLAKALNNLGNRYSEIGRRADAITPTEEALTLYRAQAADNSAYLPDLAAALGNLGARYSKIGRRADAIAPAEEAVDLWRAQAADNPAYLPDLAIALNNLGAYYSEIGRPTDAITPTEEAVNLRRAQATDNPAYLPDLAGALHNLGLHYSKVGRPTDAIEEAVNLYRAQAADNPAYLPDLAMALNNLGNRYSEIGRHADAIAPAEEAVTLRRAQAAENLAYLPDLAGALSNLGNRYSEVGRSLEAIAPAEEAVDLWRIQAHDNPAYVPDLAKALNNLGNRYSEVGRPKEAITPTEQALTLYCAQAADNPVYLPDLARAVGSLAARRAEVGLRDDADAVWQVAVESQTGFGRGYLLWSRARSAPDGDLRAAEWLIRAEADSAGHPAALSTIHECARTHRATDPHTWDRHWTQTTRAAVPAWLTLDLQLLAIARGWTAAKTYEDEFTCLLDHPVLLQSSSDVAVAEALLISNDPDRYTAIRDTAREHGVHAAYEPLFRTLTLYQFLTANSQQQHQLLTEHLDRLTHNDSIEQLREIKHTNPDDPRPRRAAALLTIATHHTDTVLRASVNALDNPTLFSALLYDTARSTETITLLPPVAELALLAATTAKDAADALLYLACAAAIPFEADIDTATEFLRQARSLAPHRATHWIGLLAELGAVHPAVLSLIPILTQEPTDGQD
ncbi:tetratricopeptide repeat protein [Nocardia sp. NPDC057272]|uniref:tetratricopeptide repeat protein n=1 Tax=Nocardia sp. NPDC057272 TaxID=3346079 RepID=UPI0036266212